MTEGTPMLWGRMHRPSFRAGDIGYGKTVDLGEESIDEGLDAARDSQQRLRVCTCDREKSSCRAAWLFSALFPALQGSNGYAEKRCESALGKTSLLSRFCGWRENNARPTRFHLANRLQ